MRKETEDSTLQWHPAFFAGIQIEFSQEKEKLEFENEHQLGTKPKQIDVLIIKKESRDKLQKNIGRIFRKYNIVEYKSPKDYLSIDDFYQVYGYACFFKADSEKINQIKANEITITFVCKKRPQKLIRHLKEEKGYQIEGKNGIYIVYGDFFPIQLILTSELSEAENFWLRYLTDDLKSVEEANKILNKYGGHQKEKLHKSVMNIIINANKEVFKEAKKMCEALSELMKDELDAREQAGEQKLKLHLIQTKLSKGKTVEAIAEDLEDSVENILSLIKEIK